MVIAIVPFALSWLIREVPLRTTLGRRAESSAEQADVGAVTSEPVAADDPSPAPAR
jgi:hypothetical protein